MKKFRPDRTGTHRTVYDSNKKKIMKLQDTCGICGKQVDKTLKPPHPLSPCIDHIIPVARGGHPSAMENLQLAHMTCNRTKSDKLFAVEETQKKVIGNRNLPHSIDWLSYEHKNLI